MAMDGEEFEALVSQVAAKDLRAEVKKRGLKAGRCPTRRDLAGMLPEDVLRELAGA